MNVFLWSQVFAGIAFLFGIIAFQFKNRRVILINWFFSAAFNAIHFYLLGRLTPCVITGITGCRFLTASFTTKKVFMYIFMVFSVAGFFYTYSGPISFLPLASALIGALGSFQKNDKYIRILLMISMSIWVVHNTIVGSPVAALMEASFLTSNLIGYIRFYAGKETNNPKVTV